MATLPKELKKNKSKLKRTPSSSSESSHGSANVEQRAALSRLVETLNRVKPEHQTGSVIQYDAGLNNNRSEDPSDWQSIIRPVHQTSYTPCTLKLRLVKLLFVIFGRLSYTFLQGKICNLSVQPVYFEIKCFACTMPVGCVN